jgi:hypothetical protein
MRTIWDMENSRIYAGNTMLLKPVYVKLRRAEHLDRMHTCLW